MHSTRFWARVFTDPGLVAADYPPGCTPGGSQANPPGVLTQLTGPPPFETAAAPF